MTAVEDMEFDVYSERTEHGAYRLGTCNLMLGDGSVVEFVDGQAVANGRQARSLLTRKDVRVVPRNSSLAEQLLNGQESPPAPHEAQRSPAAAAAPQTGQQAPQGDQSDPHDQTARSILLAAMQSALGGDLDGARVILQEGLDELRADGASAEATGMVEDALRAAGGSETGPAGEAPANAADALRAAIENLEEDPDRDDAAIAQLKAQLAELESVPPQIQTAVAAATLEVPNGFSLKTEDGEANRCLASKGDGSQCANAAVGDGHACHMGPHKSKVAALAG